MNYCLCCSNTLLRHIREGSIYWFCPSCRQEMPNTYSLSEASFSTRQHLEGLLNQTIPDQMSEFIADRPEFIPVNTPSSQP